jgi:hypothetical protein
MCGQVFGGFEEGLNALDIHGEASMYGFVYLSGMDGPPEIDGLNSIYYDAWAEEINSRLERDSVDMTLPSELLAGVNG